MTSRLDVTSVFSVCANSEKMAMIYGFEHCVYQNIILSLQHIGFTVFDYARAVDEKCKILIKKISYRDYRQWIDPSLILKKACKAALVNLIIYNYDRYLQGLSLIPIIFCIDIDNNPHPYTIHDVFDRNKPYITHAELRRAYKLCHSEIVDSRIRLIANQTFQFVHIQRRIIVDSNHQNQQILSLQKIDPPWMSSAFSEVHQRRKLTKTPRRVDHRKHDSERWAAQMHYLCGFHDPT